MPWKLTRPDPPSGVTLGVLRTKALQLRVATGRFEMSCSLKVWETSVLSLSMNGDSLAALYNAQIEELAASIEACSARWGTSRRIAVHPVIGPMSAAQWTAFHALHTRHHTRQLDRIANASSA